MHDDATCSDAAHYLPGGVPGFVPTGRSVGRRSFADTPAAPLQSGRGMVVPRGQTVKASLMAWLSSYMR
jgi:hypothetical protein